jgi:predicted DNA-binding transcriptional regulator AlpA
LQAVVAMGVLLEELAWRQAEVRQWIADLREQS